MPRSIPEPEKQTKGAHERTYQNKTPDLNLGIKEKGKRNNDPTAHVEQ